MFSMPAVIIIIIWVECWTLAVFWSKSDKRFENLIMSEPVLN